MKRASRHVRVDIYLPSMSRSAPAARPAALPMKLSAPMPDDVRAVGVAGFFRDQGGAEWQLVIPKSHWKKTDPVKLIVTGNRMELMP